MKIGYARVSTSDQSLNLQVDALKKSGCDRIFQDIESGSVEDRQGLKAAMAFARAGDSLVFWRLDRVGRSLRGLIDTVNELERRGVAFQSLTESIDTNSPGGRLIFHVFAALAEFERSIIVSRTRAGLEAARARGRIGGRPAKFDEEKRVLANKLIADRSIPINQVCELLNVSKSTLYRELGQRRRQFHPIL